MTINYPALIATKKEPEYKKNPPLPISSVGTDYSSANETNLPFGSALLTDTLDGEGNGSSTLNSKGITHIIHVAPRPRSSFSSDQDFINNVVKSVQNSIILADRNNFEKLAIPLVGGEIFAGSCPKDKIAEGIIRGAVNQLEKCQKLREIYLIDWEGNFQHYFLEKVQQIKDELFYDKLFSEKNNEFIGSLKSDKGKGVNVKVSDIRNKYPRSDPVKVIVNAANTNVGFGGGISGAISEQVGDKTKIDQKAKELIRKFYSLILKENNGKDNNSKEIIFEAKMIEMSKHKVDGGVQQGEYRFEIKDTKKYLWVDYFHPVFQNKKPLKISTQGGEEEI